MVISGKAIKRSSDFTSAQDESLTTSHCKWAKGKSPRHTSTPVQYVRRPDSVCGTSPSEMIHHRCAKWFKKPLPLPRMNNDAVLQKHYFIRIQFESIPSRVVDDSSAPLSTFPECFSNTASFPFFTQPTPARDPRTVGKAGIMRVDIDFSRHFHFSTALAERAERNVKVLPFEIFCLHAILSWILRNSVKRGKLTLDGENRLLLRLHPNDIFIFARLINDYAVIRYWLSLHSSRSCN